MGSLLRRPGGGVLAEEPTGAALVVGGPAALLADPVGLGIERLVNGTPNSGGSSSSTRTFPSWLTQWRARMAACCMACSSSGSMARTRRSRAFSFKVFKLFCLATSNRSAAEPGHSASVRTSSRAWASDRSPACSAALVSGWDSNAAAVSSAALAEPAVDPVALAIQSDTSAKPRSLCAPHAPARAAARTRAQSQTFSVRASSSTRTAQSSPENCSGSKSTSAARRPRTNSSRSLCTTPPRPARRAPARTLFRGEGRYARQPRAQAPLYPNTCTRSSRNPYFTRVSGLSSLGESLLVYRALHGG